MLHFAVDHGRLDMVTYLIMTVKVPINQQSLNGLWTPLHRCARLIHYKHAPFFEIFEFLLQHGADPMLQTADDDDECPPCTPFDLVVHKARLLSLFVRISTDILKNTILHIFAGISMGRGTSEASCSNIDRCIQQCS